MIKLLHSKMFRKNLCKWILMYVAALGLLTSVVTYSKYITSMMNDGKARTSKFIVKIEPYNDSSFKCPEDNPRECVTNVQVRPTKEVEVYFKLDLNELEVKSNVVLRASAGSLRGNFVQDNGAISSQFEILRIEEVDENREEILKTEEDYNNNKVTQEYITTGYENLQGQQTANASFVFTPKLPESAKKPHNPDEEIKRTPEEIAANIKYIKVVAKYRFSDSEMNDNNEIDFSKIKQDEIRIGYSATQVK